MVPEITIERLRAMAESAGLNLGDEELHRLLDNVNRAKKQAAELRDIIAAATEPAGMFDPRQRAGK
jgi:Ca2+-binding EF-hand superfamily protein